MKYCDLHKDLTDEAYIFEGTECPLCACMREKEVIITRHRSDNCIDRQLTQQAELLREARGIVGAVSQAKTLIPESENPIYVFIKREWKNKALTLASKIRTELGKTKWTKT